MKWLRNTFVLSLCLWCFVEGGSDPGPECQYADICQETLLLNQPCDRWPPCQEVTINVPCLTSIACTEFFDEWSPCSVTCDGGTRTRFGRCCSSKCTRITSESEACGTDPCPTGAPALQED